ncbi:histidine--tRNA ligase, cytoplasmic isoform X2 [Andrographis paniculata]|uniref:histidine--tRNA ligase, cytoplasmic isoform X2 n=1 Tax=Andrographis paniculata TaxID=175694 RepID=UPI0021E70108|nr:histidine--tRNA ligase, cytoplasmic isoform X2 [Andrographis paniculata]
MGKPLLNLNLGGKGYTLTPSSVFDFSVGLARVSIDSSLSRGSSSMSKSPRPAAAATFAFSIPDYYSSEEIRASLLVLLNKLLLSSSSSAAATQLLQILDQDALTSSDYTLTGVASHDPSLLDFPTVAVDAVSALLDHCSSALSTLSDAVAALSCEALRADISPFNLIDSGDGSSPKDAAAVAADFKVFFNGSKLVNSGKKVTEPSVAKIPSLHGSFREISRLLHSKTRVQLNSGFRAGSAEDISTALSALALSLSSLGEASFHRAQLATNSISDAVLRSRLSELFIAECPRADSLVGMYISAQSALINKGYLSFLHIVYELFDVVWKIVSWEAVAAFISLEGSDIFIQKTQGDNGNVSESSGKDNVKTDKKSEKKRKVVSGKGTAALIHFIKAKLLSGTTKTEMENFLRDFLTLLNLRFSGFDDLLVKVKEIVESNESRRLPKLPKGTRDFAKEQMAIREKAFAIITEVFKRHDAMALDTPAFELRETLMGKYGEDSKLIYDLADQVKVNHRKLLDGMLAICGVPQEKFRTICSSIDKLDKQTFDQVKREMVDEKGLMEDIADKIGTFVGLRGSPLELLSKLNQKGSEFLANGEAELALNELETLFKALEESKCISKVVFDLSLARGLDYYTGVIFETVFKGDAQVGSIAAGGRYDNLIGMFGTKQVPAVGISLGIERVFAIMEQIQKDKNQDIRATETQVLVSILGDDLSLGAKVVSELWEAKLKATFMINKRVMKHIDRAIGSRIPFMVIVGEHELSKGIVKLKDVAAANEFEIPRSELVSELQRRLKSQ